MSCHPSACSAALRPDALLWELRLARPDATPDSESQEPVIRVRSAAVPFYSRPIVETSLRERSSRIKEKKATLSTMLSTSISL